MFVLIVVLAMLTSATSTPIEYINRTLDGPFTLEQDEVILCPPIASVKIPSKVETCTKGLFIFFNCSDVEKTGFLSKNREISMTSQPTKCTETLVTFFENNDMSVKKLSNLVFLDIKSNVFLTKMVSFISAGFDDIHDLIKFCIIVLLVIVIIIIRFVYRKHSGEPSDVFQMMMVEPSKELPLDHMKNKRSIFCQCIKGCRMHKCPCRAAGIDCDEKCHGGKACYNK